MNLAPLVMLYLFGRAARGGGGGAAAPAWPSRKHPPPRKAQAHKPAAHKPAAHKPAAHHADKPAEHHATEHHAPVHREAPDDHLDTHAEHAPVHHEAEHKPSTHAEPEPVAPVAPGWHMGPAKPVRRARRRAPVHHAEAPSSPAPTDPSVVPVAQVQRILVGLGWTGPNTMQGPVQLSLRDGLWGPVTSGDWQRSASKRGLNPAISRLGPKTAHVDPDTFAALERAAAARGTVVGINGRLLRIP